MKKTNPFAETNVHPFDRSIVSADYAIACLHVSRAEFFRGVKSGVYLPAVFRKADPKPEKDRLWFRLFNLIVAEERRLHFKQQGRPWPPE